PRHRPVLRDVGPGTRLLDRDGHHRAALDPHHRREHVRGHHVRHPRSAHARRPKLMAVNPEEMEIRQDVVRRETSGATYDAGAAVRQASLWRDAWRRFTHNRAALISMVAFLILLL